MATASQKVIRTTKLLFGSLLAIVVFLGLASCLAAWWGPGAFKRRAETKLETARNPEDFQAAVGGLGVYIHSTNGAWVAIAYGDSHTAPGWQKAVALNNAGEWFESDHHFCGEFATFQHGLIDCEELLPFAATNADMAEIFAQMQAGLARHTNLYHMMLATNVTELNANLVALGFKRYK